MTGFFIPSMTLHVIMCGAMTDLQYILTEQQASLLFMCLHTAIHTHLKVHRKQNAYGLSWVQIEGIDQWLMYNLSHNKTKLAHKNAYTGIYQIKELPNNLKKGEHQTSMSLKHVYGSKFIAYHWTEYQNFGIVINRTILRCIIGCHIGWQRACVKHIKVHARFCTCNR